MDNLNKNWKAIKNIAWTATSSKQVYLDDYENIFVLKEESGMTSLIAYGHISGGYLFQSGVIDFINDIRRICEKEKWDNIAIKLVLDVPLEKFKYLGSLKQLPIDVEYYYFDNTRAGHSMPIIQSRQEEIQKLIERAKSAREDREDREIEDIEYRIMNHLIDGDAEKHGF